MDVLRSCYQTQIYSFDPVSGLNVPETINWVQCPPSAVELGRHHQYASYNWTRPIQYSEQVGEILGAARPYSKGATRPGMVGTNFCGATWTGKLTRLAAPMPVNDYGLCATCNTPVACQPRTGFMGRLVQPPGYASPQAMTQFALNRFRFFDATIGKWWHSWQVTPACPGWTTRINLFVSSSPTGISVYVQPDIYDWDGVQTGYWFLPVTSPVYPGQVALHTTI